ncbi:hypothetical protein RUND412_000307 [Rhizina undulata]
MLSLSQLISPPSPSTQSDNDHRNVQTLLDAAMAAGQHGASKAAITGKRRGRPPRNLEAREATHNPSSTSKDKGKRKAEGNTDEEENITIAKAKRETRYCYSDEQDDFIRFYRDDLENSWDEVLELYNQHWHPDAGPDSELPSRSVSGLQSRYYRVLKTPIKQRKMMAPRPHLGLLCNTDRKYPWMGVPDERNADDEEEETEETVSGTSRPCSELG